MYRSTNSTVSSASSSSFKHEKRLSYFLKINEERLALVMTSLIDKEVEVNLENGTQVKGIFNSFDPTSRRGNKAIDIAINSYASANSTAKKNTKPMIVYGNEYHFFSSHGIPKNLFKHRDQKPLSAKRGSPTKFKTDTEISSSKHTNINPVLTEWKSADSVDDSQLVELDKVEGQQWDQFETNKTEYGVVSTFDENIYTTSLNLNEVPDSVKKRAEKLAAEIEGGTEINYSKVESLLEDEDAVKTESPSVGKNQKEEKEINGFNEKEDREHKETREVKNYTDVRQFKEPRDHRETRDVRDFKDSREVRDHREVRDLRDIRDIRKREKPPVSSRTKPKFSSIDSTLEKHTVNLNDKLETDKQTPFTKSRPDKHSHQIGINALNIEPTNAKSDHFKFGFNDIKSKYSLEYEKKEKPDTSLNNFKTHERQHYSPHTETTKLVHEPVRENIKEPPKEVPKTTLNITPRESPREHVKEPPRESPKHYLKDAGREVSREAFRELSREQVRDIPKETAKKSFKFNPNASTFTPTLVTAKTPSLPSDQTPLSSPALTPLQIQKAKFEFRPFNPMKRYPKLDLRNFRSAQSCRLGEHEQAQKWEVDPTLSYRDIFGDLTPLFAHHHHLPIKPPSQMVQPGQPGPPMMPPAPQINYPPYHLGSVPVGMIPYGPQVHPRLYNGVPYNHMGPNPMARRPHPPINPRYGHASPLPNDHHFNTKSNDHYDDKHKGYGGHLKHKK